MSVYKKDQINKEAKNANLKLNEKFYKGEVEVNENSTSGRNKTAEANMKLNEKFYSEEQPNESTPTAYLNNNMAAVDVTGNKEENR
ncbi:hypothetical protein [Radiobacillus sp. PE A8.2]|uniref:hypothetical protein n=1 Tax=Radiobacillus sp. PE A8.2 TaxID=3380349 RepID=UPI00388E2A0F